MGYAPREALPATRVLVMRETRVRPTLRSAYDVAVGILEQRFGIAAGTHVEADRLFDFQREAVARARSILAHRGGVLIADSVGLGKTHVAVELLRPIVEGGGRVAIVGPAALEGHWRRAVGESGTAVWMSHTRLSRGRPTGGPYDMVVLDEAHALRNPTTRRYRAALELCRGALVVLLSATPVNNSTWDLYHLLNLFARDNDFRDVGVASLRSAFELATRPDVAADPRAIQAVLRAVMIRRGRAHVSVGAGETTSPLLRFPEQRPPHSLRYDFALADGAGLEQLGALLLELDFPAHAGLSNPAARAETPVALMRLGLLKRLESSAHAFRVSLRAYDALLASCISALDRGLLVRSSDRSARPDDEQLGIDELLFAPIQPGAASAGYRARLIAERARVDRLSAWVGSGNEDHKLATLLRLLRGPLAGTRVVVFTQFRDTARYLHAALLQCHRVGLIDGSGALLGAGVADRRSVVARFAPIANGAATPSERERIDVLVATDVLSEGFNLQDAEAVLSYDLPWNPIRLVQRIGRIDRLGSRHRFVSSYHFLPGELERYLGLVERIARKLVAIDASIGADTPAFHMDIVRALARSDARAVGTLGVGDGRHDSTPTAPWLEPRDGGWLDVDARLLHALAHARPAERRDESFEVGFLTNASADGSAGPSGLIAARIGPRFEWVAVRDGRVLEDEHECASLVELALGATGACHAEDGATRTLHAELDRLLAIVRPVLARRGSVAATGALLPAGGEQARLGRLILSLASALPGGPDAATCARIERALAGLAALPATRLPELALVACAAPAGLGVLLERVERLVGAAGLAVPGTFQYGSEPTETPVRLLGALLFSRPER